MLEYKGLKPKRTAQEMFSLIQEQQSGELPIKTFCELKKIPEAIFFYWRKKYVNHANAANELPGDKFRLLQLEDDKQNDVTLFAEYKGLKLYREVSVSYLKELMR